MRSLWIAVSILALQVLTHAAQSQPSPKPATSTAATLSQVTVTGCLQPATVPTGASPSTGSTPYVLANAATIKAGSEAAAPSGTPSAAGASGAASGNASGAVATSGTVEVTSYVLHGQADELKKHLGHRVEITGAASEAAPSAAGAGSGSQPQQQVIPHEPHRGPVDTGASPGGTARGTAHPSVQHLSVTSVRMLGATCQ